MIAQTSKSKKQKPMITEVFLIFLRLGLTSFGGPIAHLSYFHDEFVKKKKWIEEHAYADVVALCQFLPGPASSQVGMAIGLTRAGIFGALAAWLGFTLPSAIILVLFGLGITKFHFDSSWLHGLQVVAVAVVAQAIWQMANKLCPDRKRASIAVGAAVIAAAFPSAIFQIFIILIGGILGIGFLRTAQDLPVPEIKNSVSKRTGTISLIFFAVLLLLLPVTARIFGFEGLTLFQSFYRSGSLVFGGGHVVLPLLEAGVVKNGWVSKNMFMAGYGAAQAVPGPLFSFAAFLGSVLRIQPTGWAGAILCLVAIYLPSFLLVIGVMPFWESLRRYQKIRFAMLGINAAVVGLLLAAFYNPVWTSAIFKPEDFALALLAFCLLAFWNTPSWLVVLMAALLGGLHL